VTEPDRAVERVASLASRLTRPAGGSKGRVVVDLAPQSSISAIDLAALGLDYLGVPTDPVTAARQATTDDASVPGEPVGDASLSATLAHALRGRRVAAISIGDTLNRVHDLGAYLAGLRALCHQLGDAPVLVVSPNVTHIDVAAKLVIGRWDVTASGTLCADYVRHFSGASLRSTMTAHGFVELDTEDRTRAHSDQHFPSDAAVLDPATPVGALLGRLREMAGGDAHVDRLVRAYASASTGAPGPVPGSTADRLDTQGAVAQPFLSVLLRTQGRRTATLQESLLCLAAQTCDDFEVLTLLHDGDTRALDSVRALIDEFHESFASRVRVVQVMGGGRCRPLNEGATLARGEYIAMLDDDDLVLANWVETFRDEARRSPGRVVRTAVATQRIEARPGRWGGEDGYEVIDRPRLVFSLDFDHIDHLLDNRTPNNGYAFPRSLVTDLGLRWDESLPVLEDWDHLLWCASICGVSGVPQITALLRSWEVGEDSKSQHSQALWETTRQRVIEMHGAVPLLLDRGAFPQLRARLIDGDVASEHAARLERDAQRTAGELAAARARLELAERALASATHELEELRRSTSWRITAGLRLAARAARRLRTPQRHQDCDEAGPG
jgi:hypothetical protein